MLGKKFYLHLELAPGVSLGYEKNSKNIRNRFSPEGCLLP